MIYNPYIVVPVATWAITQVAKFTIAALRGRLDFRYLYSSGGMPSVHSAVVCSLAVTALLVDGADSHLFGFAAVFAAIVMYDSFGVRRSVGEQATALNLIVAGLDRGKVRLEQPVTHLREILGHQPSEVTVGAVLGVVLGGLLNYDRLGPITSWLQTMPIHWEWWAYAIIGAVLVVGGIAQRLVISWRFGSSPTLRQLSRRILTAAETIGWLVVIAVIFSYEHASFAAWRLWPVLVLGLGVVWGVLITQAAIATVPTALAEEATVARKRKWLSFGRKRRPKRK